MTIEKKAKARKNVKEEDSKQLLWKIERQHRKVKVKIYH
jgi:hypothetical protein